MHNGDSHLYTLWPKVNFLTFQPAIYTFPYMAPAYYRMVWTAKFTIFFAIFSTQFPPSPKSKYRITPDQLYWQRHQSGIQMQCWFYYLWAPRWYYQTTCRIEIVTQIRYSSHVVAGRQQSPTQEIDFWAECKSLECKEPRKQSDVHRTGRLRTLFPPTPSTSALCLTYRSITFEMLAISFEHSLTYQQTVESKLASIATHSLLLQQALGARGYAWN